MKNTLRILLVASNPKDQPLLWLDEEARAISKGISESKYRERLEFNALWATRVDDLLVSLNDYKPHVVHFSGHGRKAGEIILTDEFGFSKPVSAGAIKKLFESLKNDIHLVFLNSCYSQAQAKAIRETIDCVVGMRRAISDSAAIKFATAFYRAIGFSCSVQNAFDQAIAALMLENIPEEKTPVLLHKENVDLNKLILVAPFNVSGSLIQREDYQHVVFVPSAEVAKDDSRNFKRNEAKKHKVRMALEQIEKIRKDRRFAFGDESLIFVDIDNFTRINEKFTDKIGNKVLQTIEALLKNLLPRQYTTRLSGDEFVAYLSDEGLKGAMRIARKLQAAVSNYSWANLSPDLFVSCGMGVVSFNRNEDTKEGVLRALFGAKGAKRIGHGQIIEGPDFIPEERKKDIWMLIS